jgi:tetraacyldisaccharide 4'-kinase
MVRTALLPLAGLYGAVLFFRNKAFDWGILRSARVPVPVLAVGNLTAGGTGKTPLVEYLVDTLQIQGRRVAVVSRGYGRASRGVVVVSEGNGAMVDALTGGDEAVQVAHKFPAAAVVVGERRIDAARVAVQKLAVDVIILDDAYQHRWIHRDLNILVLDGEKDLRREMLLPAGLRREGLSGVRRADLVAWSGLRAGFQTEKLRPQVGNWFAGPMVAYRTDPTGLNRASIPGGVGSCRGKRVMAFCGIGNPGRFVASLRELGGEVVRDIAFPDHHWYRPKDIDRILTGFREAHADIMVTTEKDWVRMQAGVELKRNFLEQYPVWYLQLTVKILEGEGILIESLHRVLKSFQAT